MAIADPIDERAVRFTQSPRKMLIGADWVDAASGKTFESLHPATGEVLAHVAEGSSEDIDRAVKTARAAFEAETWRGMKPNERGRIMHRLGDLMLEHADELAALESLDNGKPLAIARAADVELAADIFHYMSGWVTKIEGYQIPISVPYMPGVEFHAYALKDPIGVVGQIIPWNFPLLMAAWKLAPALATGVTVVLKPAEQTPLTALRLGELILEAGVPPGVVNIVTGFGDAGAALAAHDGVDKVAFTGSTAVGKLLVKAAAGNLKKLTLELGGKSRNIVFSDADMETAVPGEANAIFFNHGQCCCAGARLYVESKDYDDVLQGVTDHAKSPKVGSGQDPQIEMGPLVSQSSWTACAASLIRVGTRAPTWPLAERAKGEKGYFVEPTVLTETNPNMKVEAEEIFVGYKESGWGREMGHEVLENYLETKSVCVQL